MFHDSPCFMLAPKNEISQSFCVVAIRFGTVGYVR